MEVFLYNQTRRHCVYLNKSLRVELRQRTETHPESKCLLETTNRDCSSPPSSHWDPQTDQISLLCGCSYSNYCFRYHGDASEDTVQPGHSRTFRESQHNDLLLSPTPPFSCLFPFLSSASLSAAVPPDNMKILLLWQPRRACQEVKPNSGHQK